jgi:hypothetical protein
MTAHIRKTFLGKKKPINKTLLYYGQDSGMAIRSIYLQQDRVMQTRPVIIPCTAPITDGLPKKEVSRMIHVRRPRASTHVSVKNGQRCIGVGRKRTSTVESCPPHPKQACARKHQNYVVWCEALPILLTPRAHLKIK